MMSAVLTRKNYNCKNVTSKSFKMIDFPQRRLVQIVPTERINDSVWAHEWGDWFSMAQRIYDRAMSIIRKLRINPRILRYTPHYPAPFHHPEFLVLLVSEVFKRFLGAICGFEDETCFFQYFSSFCVEFF